MPEHDSSFKRAVDGIILQRISRVAIVAATCALPIAGWGIKRIIDKADTVVEITAQSARKIDLMEQQIRLTGENRQQQIDVIKAEVKDHEGRIRGLERTEAGLGRLPPP
jgi:hypothetical protein